MKKNAYIIFSLCAVIVLLGVGCFIFAINNNLMKGLLIKNITPTPTPAVSPSPDETADWKTFSQDTYGFSIRYPANWEMAETQERGALKTGELYKIILEERSSGIWTADLDVVVFNEEEHGRAEVEWQRKCLEENKGRIEAEEGPLCMISANFIRVGEAEDEQLTIAGQPAYRTRYFAFDSEAWCTVTHYGQYDYKFCYTGETPNDPDLDEHLETINAILATVQFFPSKVNTAGWKTYNDETFGFQFQYPPTMQLRTEYEYAEPTQKREIHLRLMGNGLTGVIQVNPSGSGGVALGDTDVIEKKMIAFGGIPAELQVLEQLQSIEGIPAQIDPATLKRAALVFFDIDEKRHFYIYFTYLKSEPAKEEDVEQILSTFKFTQ